MKRKMITKNSVFIAATIVIFFIFAFGSWYFVNRGFPVSPQSRVPVTELKAAPGEQYSEAAAITPSMDFTKLKNFFQNLAEKKGGRYAFEVLKRITPGPNIDMHLLGHAVGDILYKQEGLNGITACDNDFRNACSHSIVIGLFFDKGDGALPEIAEACRKAPGGSGAYTMCFHGLGHGILSYEGYDFAKGAAMCLKTGTAEYNYQEGTQCIGGMVMEIIEGGGHDPELWAEQRKKYLDPRHPTALCENSSIPDQSKFMCYEYLTPYLFEAAGANAGNPTAEDFKKAFTYCKTLPASNPNRNVCFGGFGKEFDGLVQSRDIRKDSFTKISDSGLKQIYTWCLFAADKNGTAACIVDAMNSLYWGGENDRSVAIRFCANIPETDAYNRTSCVQNLTNAVAYYISDSSYRDSFCQELPQQYQDQCHARLSK